MQARLGRNSRKPFFWKMETTWSLRWVINIENFGWEKALVILVIHLMHKCLLSMQKLWELLICPRTWNFCFYSFWKPALFSYLTSSFSAECYLSFICYYRVIFHIYMTYKSLVGCSWEFYFCGIWYEVEQKLDNLIFFLLRAPSFHWE